MLDYDLINIRYNNAQKIENERRQNIKKGITNGKSYI